MKIEIRLFATLVQYLPPGSNGRRTVLEVAGGSTVGQVLDRLGIPRNLSKLIMVDGVHRGVDTVLQDGNVLSVFPPIAGG